MNSYHIFYFPFKWEIKGRENKLFSEQTRMDNIKINPFSNWLKSPEINDEKEMNDLYNEKNFYYEFVHPVLYDTGKENSLLLHFERIETRQNDVTYTIAKHEGKTYKLKVEAINLNLYTTGVGMLSFFLINDELNQNRPEDILTINQYGRRIFPPFYNDIDLRYEIAEYLSIEGLNGDSSRYYEDFKNYNPQSYWKPACFIHNLIEDLSDELIIQPIIDDRMFVNCWYGNDELVKEYKKLDQKGLNNYFLKNDFWYKYLFVDVSSPSCKNDKMRLDLLENQTYKRWQHDGMLYGVSRYSFVMISDTSFFQKEILAPYMRTNYSKMIELIFIQRASTLRFSGEITKVSQLSKENKLDKEMVEKISSLYKEYIRFINQINFREVTTQDQGIELYQLMSDTLMIQKYVESLDKEIDELHQYLNLLDDRARSENVSYLNKIATIFLPATLIAGLFGMNAVEGVWGQDGEIVWQMFIIQLGFIGLLCYLVYILLKKK